MDNYSIDRRRRRGIAALLVVAGTIVPGVALGQDSDGFAVNRFNPSERGSDWFWAESLDLRGNNRWAFGLVGDWAYKPLVAYTSEDDEAEVLIRHQVYAHLGASVVFADRIRVGVNLPILAYQKAQDVDLGQEVFEASSGAALGDLRLGADVRLVGKYGDPATLAVGAQLHFPTGSEKKYSSDAATRMGPRVAVAGDIGIFTYAAKSGVNLRFAGDSVAGEAFGHEWTFGGAAGVRLLEKKLTVGPEIWASTVIEDGSLGFFGDASTPVEGVLGAHYKTESGWRVGLGVGPGLSRGLGSPRVRTLASVEWLPEPPVESQPRIDTDGDGIFDENDACPTKPGSKSADRAKHGCPLPEDSDGDGIIDSMDACPNEAGVESNEETKHGCPVRDRDLDGILDSDDACMDEPGVPQEDPGMNGCPLPKDTDGDGILDEDDSCPEVAGPESTEKAEHGCPRAQVVDGQVRILDRIEFASGSDKIGESSISILDAVLKVFVENPAITKVRIEGHTDNRGAAWLNKDLSRRRALAVKKWLTEKGIEAGRLTSVGIGPARPIEDNDTPEGRQNNRRVEFHILEEEANKESAQ